MLTEELIQMSANQLHFTNLVEGTVRIGIQHAIKEIDMCHCYNCQLKACAIALNALPTKYVTTSKDSRMTEMSLMSQSFQFQIVLEISKALKTVKDHCLH